jgi:CheY-like chemotaxis protein
LSLARSGARWDVVLSDLVMPGMNGIELAERLVETCPALSVRIVLMTGGTPSRAIDSALASCGLPTISKPFDLAVLLELLSKVTSGHS